MNFLLDGSRTKLYLSGEERATAKDRFSFEKRTQIIGLLVEGNSHRATSRLADVSINTVTKLLVDLGTACQEYHDKHPLNVQSKHVQCDEIWSSIYGKEKNLSDKLRGKYG